MKKNAMLKNTVAVFITAAIFTSCNNTTTPEKTSGDSTKMQQSTDSSKMMNNTNSKMMDTTTKMEDTAHKSDQIPPPKN